VALSQRQWLKLLGIGTASTLIALPLKALSQSVVATPTPTTNHINVFQAFVLGFVQGVTEFLPISSSAHLKVVPVAFGWGDPGVAFTAVIQLGSIAAVLWYFWDDLKNITLGSIAAIANKEYNSQEFKLGLGIIVGTIPIVFFGLLIKIFIPDFDNSPLRSLMMIPIASIAVSFFMALGEKIGTRKRKFDKLGVMDGILMGLAQSLALIPGVSRSGSTITAGLFMGLERSTAARFSFLLGIPAITLAGLVEIKTIAQADLGEAGLLPIIVGVLSAGIFSYLAIAWLLRFLQNRTTWIFIWYRLIFALVILAALATGLVENI
jgi:undecaprenyl-diphosphatase